MKTVQCAVRSVYNMFSVWCSVCKVCIAQNGQYAVQFTEKCVSMTDYWRNTAHGIGISPMSDFIIGFLPSCMWTGGLTEYLTVFHENSETL